MTKREIAALACKILAIYAFILALGALGTIVWGVYMSFTISRAGSGFGAPLGWNPAMVLIASIPSALYLAAGFYLWFSADWLAARMVRDDTALDFGGEIFAPSEWKKVGFAVAGALVLATAIPELGSVVFASYFNVGNRPGITFGFPNTKDFVALIFKTVFGFWLFAGAPSLFQILGGIARLGKTQPRRVVGENRDEEIS